MRNCIAVFLLLLVGSSFALTNVSSCQAIIASDTYVLTQDLSGNPISIGGGTGCINIATSNVVLDCDGHSLTGPGTIQTYGVNAGPGVVNITIRNCVISDYRYGINLNAVNGALIEGNDISNAGVALTAGTASNNVVSRNNEYYSSQDGFDVTSHNNENMSSIGDYIHDNGRYGIRFSGTSGVLVANGTIEENQNYDIYVSLSAWTECNMSVDNVTGSGGRPILFFNSSGSISDMEPSELIICRGNNFDVNNVSVRGSDTIGNNGIFIIASSNVSIQDSESNDNEYGVFTYVTDDLTVTNSIFSGNDYDGIHTSQGNRNVFSGVTANQNGEAGIYVNSPTDGNDIQNNTANMNGDEGFVIHDAYGIFRNNSGSLNGGHGVHLSVANMSIEGNNFSTNNGTGIYAEASEWITYEGNHLCGNNGSGLDLAKVSHDNLVRENIGCENGQAGFVISSPKGESDNNVIENNTAYLNGDGFVINSSISTGNNIRNNIARDNLNSGFMLDGTSGNTIEWNNATSNQAGFLFVSGSNDNNIYNDRASGGNHGFRFLGSSDNIMYGCLANDNINTGFYERYGLGDSGGTAATTIINSRFYNNGWEITQATAYGRQFNVTNSTLGSASVRFSMLDSVNGDVLGMTAYSINETSAPGPAPAGNASFWGKYVKVWFQSDQFIDSMTFHWEDEEAQAFNESGMSLLTWNNSAWVVTPGQTLDEAANSLEAVCLANITEDDYYGLFVPFTSDEDDEGGSDDEPISLDVETGCEGNVISATSGSDPVAGARVVLDGLLEGFTDSGGEFEFAGCGKTVLVYVNKDGFTPEQETFELIDCAQCQGECEDNSDCPDDMQCSANECVDVPCECGTVMNHECVHYECCDDSGCGDGQVCQGNSCVDVSSEGCSADSECAASEYCDEGECKDVSGECGYAENHSWVSYECGDDESCPECASGFACENNICVEYSIEGPESGDIGGGANITVSREDAPCSGCDLQITSPSGKKSVGKTDGNGNYQLGLLEVGEYEVALVKDGEAVAATKVVGRGVQQEVPEQKPEGAAFDYLSLIVLVLIALIIIVVVVFRRRRK